MRPNPSSTYHLASPKTWELIRGAYLSGLSAPALAARFGASVGAIRKRAGREGWTKRAYAQALDGPGVSGAADASADPFGAPSAAASAEAPPEAWARLAAALPPLRVSPAGLARRALGDAARALGEGRVDEARKLVGAAQAVVRLEQTIDLDDQWGDDPFEQEARHARLHRAMFEMAADLAERLAAGEALPPQYAHLHADWLERTAAQSSAASAAQD